MNYFNLDKNNRRSIRLVGYDYSQAGIYFITICCQDKAHLFGKVEMGQMQLNLFGKIALEEWFNTASIRDNILLHECIVMPNHIHGIIEITFQKISSNEVGTFKSTSQTIGAIVRGYKIATIKKIKDAIQCRDELQFAQNNDLQFVENETSNNSTIQIIKSLDYKIWQRNFYEHIIKDRNAYRTIVNYIINNSLNWTEDKFY